MTRKKSNKRVPRRRPECDRAVSAEQQVRFLLGIRNGLTVAAAAKWADVAVTTIYNRRRIDESFAALWREAVEGANADAAAVRAAEWAAADAAQGTKVSAHGDRLAVRKRRRKMDFTRKRKQDFLDHFADSCNMAAAAAAAGVTERNVRKALAEDEAFAEGFDVALGVGYKALEADTLSQAQQAYRLSPDGPSGADSAGSRQTFERSMQLLHEYRRRDGTIGRRPSRHHRKTASKEELIAAIMKNVALLKKRRELLLKAGKPWTGIGPSRPPLPDGGAYPVPPG